MSRMLFLWAIGPLLVALSASLAFVEAVRDRLAEVWPIAFPTAPPDHRSLGDWPSHEDAKPVARRFREYRDRVMARTAFSPAPRLIAAA